MDMAQLSNTLLQIFYIMIGLYMGLTMVFTIKDKNHKTRIGTALFWGILSAVFMFGDYIPSQIVGALVIVIAVLSATKQINIGTLKQLDETFATLKAEKLGLKIFIPSINSDNSNAYSIIYRFLWNSCYRYIININFSINICNN